MIATIVTLIGNAVTDVRVAATQAGVPVGHFRMAATPRRFDTGLGRWIDGDSTFITVNCWRSLAENTAASIHKGDPVVVTGRLRTRSWERDGVRREELEVEATSVGHDLARGRSRFERTPRGPQLVGDGRDVVAAAAPEAGLPDADVGREVA